MDEDSFLETIHGTDVKPQSLALKYAVCAHAAALSTTYSHWKTRFYQASRSLMDTLEIDNPEAFASVPTLQACVLIALFDLKNALFSRAWTSLCKATWLSQMLGLHLVDQRKDTENTTSSRASLSVSQVVSVMEERRATFWVICSLNCITGAGIGWSAACNFGLRDVSILCQKHQTIS